MSMPVSWRRLPSVPLVFTAAACLIGSMIALLPPSQLVLVAAMAFALIALAVVLAEPAAGLAIALIVGPLQPLERVTLQLPLDSGQIVLAVALLAYGFRWLATRRSPVRRLRSPIVLALGAFLAVCLLTFWPARDFGEWANECIKWSQVLIIALLVANECDPRRRSLLLAAVLISAAGQAIYGIVQADIRGSGPREFLVLGSETRYRAYGTFEQPNPFGGFMGLTWPVAAAVGAWALWQLGLKRWGEGAVRRSSRVSPWLWCLVGGGAFAVAVLCVYALIASGSRGALVGAGAAGAAMVLVLLRRPLYWLIAAAMLAALLYGFDVINVPASLEAQLQQYGDLDVRNAHVTPLTFSTIERLAHWQAAVRMIESSPWLGVGFGNYAAAYPDFRLLPWENALGHAHNYYLNVFAETGAIGLIVYLVLWITIFAVTWCAARKTEIVASPDSSLVLRPAAMTWSSAICIGILGAWAHLTAHHLFDKLYVANMHVLIGVYLGWVMASDSFESSR